MCICFMWDPNLQFQVCKANASAKLFLIKSTSHLIAQMIQFPISLADASMLRGNSVNAFAYYQLQRGYLWQCYKERLGIGVQIACG